MREEEEILDELNALDGYVAHLRRCSVHVESILTPHSFRELKSFSPEAHWFCPKRFDDDPIDYSNPDEPDEDMSAETIRELMKDFERRQEVAYKYSLIFGLSPEDAGQPLEDYEKRLDDLLTSCHQCVHNWQMGRKAYLKVLAE